MTASSSPQIDIVITWVNGDDPALQQKRAQYQPSNLASRAVSATRFASNDEIYYNVASILKYVPFSRHIYIVTDQQQPALIDAFAKQGLCVPDKIRIVDHKEIFAGYEQYLPTFNSLTIETMLWNIKGLSDYFICLDDDFFFNQPARLDDFLVDSSSVNTSSPLSNATAPVSTISNKDIVIRGYWRKNTVMKTKLKYRQFLNKTFNKPLEPKYTVSQMLGAALADGGQKNTFFEIHHYPHIVDKACLTDYLLNHPDVLQDQISHKFRDVSQFDPISLMNHLKIAQHEAIFKPNVALNYLKDERQIATFIADLDNKTMKYGCIQSMDQLAPSAFKQVNDAMQQKFADYLPEVLAPTSH